MNEYHFHLKWHQSKWTKGTQSLTCIALLNLKSSMEKLDDTWIKQERDVFYLSNVNNINLGKQKFQLKLLEKLEENQNYSNDQKMITKC